MLQSVPGTNQYYAMRVTFLTQGNNLNTRLTDYESDALPTAPRRHAATLAPRRPFG